MVKPPKTMQPEAVPDMRKAGRDRQKAFGDDSFHTYMARKIDLQRHQFGVQLPPSPPSHPVDVPPKTSSKSVRFSFEGNHTAAPKSEKKKKKHFGVTAVLKRLQLRHGGTESTAKRRFEETDCVLEPALAVETESISTLSDDHPLSSHGSISPTEQSDANCFKKDCENNNNSVGKKRSKLSERPDLFFRGVVVLINGYTHPDGETLQRLLQQHGGDVERYETSRVTHVIAEQLSSAKANLYRKQKRNPMPVCRPSWIVDSVAAFSLLPYQKYVLDDVKKDKDVVSVAAFFQRSSDGNAGERVDQSSVPADCVEVEKRGRTVAAVDTMSPLEPLLSNDKTNLLEEELINNPNAAVELPPPIDDMPVIAGKVPSEERLIHGRVRTVGTDPNFLESFFAASRLSFIGSYRQRTRSSPSKRNGRQNGAESDVERFVFHVDMDCFFASVVLRNYPQYRDKPVAISHNGEKQGRASAGPGRQNHKDSSSECATCNYEARKYGVKKGMFLGQAKALCPDLILLQYDFEGYEEVSDAVSEILHRYALEHSGYVEHVSCDEAYVEFHIPSRNEQTPSLVAGEIAEAIREEIYAATQCTATVGVAANKFLAKLATDHVKPNKSYVMGDFQHILKSIQLKDLHGIGYKMRRRLEDEALVSVQDIWDLGDQGEVELCRILGPALGKKVFGYCHGKDDRPVQASERKTIGAECSYGVRFDGPYGVDHMIEGLCKEVEKRMTNVGVKGIKVTLKVKQRKAGAPPPPKYLGHGSCHNLSKTGEVKSGAATRDWNCFYEVAMNLYSELNIDKVDVRGMGVVISKLVADTAEKQVMATPRQSIAKWFNGNVAKSDPLTVSSKRKVEFSLPDTSAELVESDEYSTGSDILWVGSGDKRKRNDIWDDNDDIALPALSQIHMSQVKELPSPLRKKVVLKMEIEKGKNSTVHVPEPEENDHGSRDIRRRQTNVKRMLRLAAVKSGATELRNESGQAISLTQLDCLPLDLQLEIANSDSHGLGALSPPPKTNRKGESMLASKSSFITESPQALSSPTVNAKSANSNDTNAAHSDVSTTPLPIHGTVDFERDNLRPLTLFLDEHSPADVAAMQQVTEFLCLCVTQNRLSDAVQLLRSIQNRSDLWGIEHGFDLIFDAVNQQVELSFRASLDKDGLRKL